MTDILKCRGGKKIIILLRSGSLMIHKCVFGMRIHKNASAKTVCCFSCLIPPLCVSVHTHTRAHGIHSNLTHSYQANFVSVMVPQDVFPLYQEEKLGSFASICAAYHWLGFEMMCQSSHAMASQPGNRNTGVCSSPWQLLSPPLNNGVPHNKSLM